MAGSFNQVLLIGRLTRDPELRVTSTGASVCQLGLATNHFSRGENNERQEVPDFHDIVVWNNGTRKLADICKEYLSKGRLVGVVGELRSRSWQDKDTGAKRYKTEVLANNVIFLDSKPTGDASASSGGSYGGAPRSNSPTSPSIPNIPELTHEDAIAASHIRPDDIPF